MRRKRACLIINPYGGKNATKIADLIAVLSAAGWKTEMALKAFGGQSMALARRAVKAHYDLVVGYGGDGTLNQVLNGAMRASRRSSAIGVIPGGTANVWAAEIGVPSDPVKAALTLVSSEVRGIDIGRVEVQELAFPDVTVKKTITSPLLTHKPARKLSLFRTGVCVFTDVYHRPNSKLTHNPAQKS